MSAIDATQNTSLTPKKALLILAGAATGLCCAIGLKYAALSVGVSLKALDAFDLTALVLGFTFLVFGVVTALLSTSRRQLAKQLEGEAAELPATAEEVRTIRLQAAGLVLAGVMLWAPVFIGSRFAHSTAAAVGTVAAIAVLFLVQTVVNVRFWRSSDEFMRQMVLTIGAVTFALGQGALFLYAVAERLHLVRALTTWDILVLLLALYLVVSLAVSIRRTQR